MNRPWVLHAPTRWAAWLSRVGALLFWLGTCAADAQVRPGWTLVWADEFDGPNGSRPNPEWWVYDRGGGGWGNNELQTYTDRTNNCRIENGCLVIEAHRETFTGSDGITRAYTSARIKTQGRLEWRFGRIEARIRVPRGQGLWPAFWMLGTNFPSVGWPNCGEIDIMENIGREPSTVHGTIHGPGYSGGNAVGGRYTLPGGAELADDFHVFAVEWETNRIRWFIDDTVYFTATPASLPTGRPWVFHQWPFFLILNVAVGGNWPGAPDATTEFPQRMWVDYVRVYQRTPALPVGCGGNTLANPGFETGDWSGWTRFGGNTYLHNRTERPVHTGMYVFKVFGQFTGAPNDSGVSQELPVLPGQRFRAAGWVMNPADDRLAGENHAWLEVSFRDAAGNTLAVYRSAPVTAATPAGTWWRLGVTNRVDPTTGVVWEPGPELVAPFGSAQLRFQAVFRQPALAAGSVLFDDLECVLQPAPPVALEVHRQGQQLVLRFPTCPGAQYALLGSDQLPPVQWQLERLWTGDGDQASVSVALGAGAARFFTVQRW
ncbi:MAG: family 16 glycosylhydrolase [Limisphaera sp.]